VTSPGRRRVLAAVVMTVVVVACDPTPTPSPSATAGTPTITATAPVAPPTVGPSPTPGWSPVATVTLNPSSLGDLPPAVNLAAPVAIPSGFLVWQPTLNQPSVWSGTPDGATWQLLDSTGFGGDPIAGIATSGSRLVLATTALSPGESTRLWFTTDGRSWGEDHDPPAALLDANGDVRLVGGPAGFALTGEPSSGDNSRVLWASQDGQRWVKAPVVDGVDFERVIVAQDGFVTFGGSDGWTTYASTDGTTWSQASGTAPQELVQSSTDVTIAMPDGLIALSSSDPTAPTYAWRLQVSMFSTGARATWTALGPLPGSLGTSVIAGTASERGVVLLGYDATYRPLTWTSRNGTTWTRNVLPQADFGGGVPASIRGGPGVYVTMGWDVDPYGQAVGQPWVSADGATWSPVATPAFGATTAPTGVCPAGTSFDFDRGGLPLNFELAPDCFGSRTLTMTGWARDCGGCGGTGPFVATPSWLIDALGYYRFWLGSKDGGHGIGGGGIGVQTAPGVFVPGNVPPSDDSGIHVEVSGHFADSAASTCRIRPSLGSGASVPPIGEAIATCRQTFVVTHIRVLA
jgi:hypothetical protein